ncbi:23S rRNA (guanosine(2251)-2'-O)-methyltransferase RlmB [Candidatus Dojkabacteria bacterium]|nr:23S rRNA (guanosine(2251)-2'-O)-methyltransferase RlmB [Candidatus Dojkabacteria bacterium]
MKSNKGRFVQVENKNALLELLQADIPFEKVYVANNAFRDPKTKQIMAEARERGIPIEKITRKRINRLSRSPSCESIIGLKPVQNVIKLSEVLEQHDPKKPLFLIILSGVRYSQNLGAILRSAFGAGVTAVILPKRKNRVQTEEVTRISMGASERIPIVQTNIFDAIKKLKDYGVKIVGVHMRGNEYYKVDISGNTALVLGAEDTGISKRILDKCDALVKIPMEEGLGSLNVSSSAAILMYEKKRQDSR